MALKCSFNSLKEIDRVPFSQGTALKSRSCWFKLGMAFSQGTALKVVLVGSSLGCQFYPYLWIPADIIYNPAGMRETRMEIFKQLLVK